MIVNYDAKAINKAGIPNKNCIPAKILDTSKITDRRSVDGKLHSKTIQSTLFRKEKKKASAKILSTIKNLIKSAKVIDESIGDNRHEMYRRPYEMNFSDDEKKNKYISKRQPITSKPKASYENIDNELPSKFKSKFMETPKWKQKLELKKVTHKISGAASSYSENSDFYASDNSQSERSVYSQTKCK